MIQMIQDSGGNEPQPQDADDQRLTGGQPVGEADEEQARREELEYGDSGTAVSPDTQRSDPGAAEDLGDTDGLSSRGQSADDEGQAPPGTADEDRNPDQDVDPSTSRYAPEADDVSGADVIHEARARNAEG
ncbi:MULTISPECIES: hypothetical protein [unclassified Nocardioides]|uniref:hypothetical protein n=1 Tax=unclassified Nocardioides TaxID=2615069 RepID=UPI0012F78497|nr:MULTISPECIES: hypothetical protein [unclassified Nocardioides]